MSRGAVSSWIRQDGHQTMMLLLWASSFCFVLISVLRMFAFICVLLLAKVSLWVLPRSCNRWFLFTRLLMRCSSSIVVSCQFSSTLYVLHFVLFCCSYYSMPVWLAFLLYSFVPHSVAYYLRQIFSRVRFFWLIVLWPQSFFRSFEDGEPAWTRVRWVSLRRNSAVMWRRHEQQNWTKPCFADIGLARIGLLV